MIYSFDLGQVEEDTLESVSCIAYQCTCCGALYRKKLDAERCDQ